MLKRRLKEIKGKDCYLIGSVRLPLVDKIRELSLCRGIYEDTFFSYLFLFLNDRYNEKIVDICDSIMPEGLYGLQNDKVNVTVEPGDIVIDAGSWIGDFAAYACERGCCLCL